MNNNAGRIRTLAFCLVACMSILQTGCTGLGKKAKTDEVKSPVVGSGSRNVIRSIDFVGNVEYKDSKLKKKVGFEVGDYLDPVLAETGRGIISSLYRKKGYPHTSILINDAKIEEGVLIYIIDEGPRVQIRSVKFQGNSGIKSGELKGGLLHRRDGCCGCREAA